MPHSICNITCRFDNIFSQQRNIIFDFYFIKRTNNSYVLQEEFDDTKGVIRIRKSKKDRKFITAKNNFKNLIPIFWADMFDIIRICNIVLTHLVFDTKRLKILKWLSEAEKGKKTDNTMSKRKRTNRQTLIHNTLHRKTRAQRISQNGG